MSVLSALETSGVVAAIGTSRLVVIVATLAALVGAWVVARNVRVGGPVQPLPGTYDAPIVAVNLIDPQNPREPEPKIVGVFEKVLLVALLAYAFLDRGFAWFHIPGTPLFVGELVLLFGAVAILSHPTALLAALRRSPPMKLLGLFMGWGFGLLVFLGIGYGVDAIRDSAIWYYGAVAIFVLFLLLSDPLRVGRWLAVFARIIPWLIGWLFLATVLDALVGDRPPYAPDSQVSIFSHSAGNAAVILVICLAFVWLVDHGSEYFTPSQRIAITGASGALLLLLGLKNRGGLVAGALGIVAILIFMNRRRSEILVTLIGVASVLLAIALVSQVSVALFGSREISAEQFLSNITSIVSPSSGNERETTTTEWRLELWTRVLDDVNSEFPITGYGPGPDLGKIYNVTTNDAVPLRNPHNSHVGVIARLGWVGLGVWFVMWSVWALLLLDLRTRLARRGRLDEAGFVAVLMIGAGMILVNAFFDPTLEGPQVGMWTWFLFGLGAALQLVYHGFPAVDVQKTTSQSTPARRAPAETVDGTSG